MDSCVNTMPRGVASKVTNEMNNLVSPQDVAGNPAFLLVLSTTLMVIYIALMFSVGVR